jgi:hypothetical protein
MVAQGIPTSFAIVSLVALLDSVEEPWSWPTKGEKRVEEEEKEQEERSKLRHEWEEEKTRRNSLVLCFLNPVVCFLFSSFFRHSFFRPD